MIYPRMACFVVLAISITAFGATTGPASMPAAPPIPRQVLDKMDQRELGKLYNSADSDKLYAAHQLLERYFAYPESRKQTIASLQALNLDPNIVGRLTRLRMNWPDMPGGVYYINEKVGPYDVRYFLGVPTKYDRMQPWPVVIKLPEADAFVADPKPDPIQVTQIYSAWMSQELQAHPDSLVIMPLLNLDYLYGPSYQGMNSVIQPLMHAANRVNIDPARIYLLGHAMSGHAAWNIPLHYPTYFAAFNVLAGGAAEDWQRLRLMNLRNVLAVVWQDADDTQLKPDLNRQLVRALKNLKCDVDYTETKNVGHVPTPQIAEQCYQKMVARVRELYPKQISIQSNRPDELFNRSDWVQLYQPLNSGEEKRLYFQHADGYMLVFPTAFGLDATLSENTIKVTSRNVGSMRFYFNDQMIDFSRSVAVFVNGRGRFEGYLKPDLETMLKDQLFLGRGWRYFTAAVDIDFGDLSATTRPKN